MSTKTTLRNLVRMVGAGGIPLSTVSVYLYYVLREGEPTTYRQIKKDLLLSTASVNRHNRILSAIDVLDIDSSPGRPTVYSPKELSDEGLKKLLAPLLKGRKTPAPRLSSSLYIDDDVKRREVYNRMFKFKRQEEQKNSRPARDLAKSIPAVQTILDILPSDQRNFRVSPGAMKRLHELDVDVSKYIAWFVKVKLVKLIPRFNMGIFLYSGMIEEYKRAADKMTKVEKYKTVGKRLKGSFDKRASDFKKEMV
jgi:hypothetical protein